MRTLVDKYFGDYHVRLIIKVTPEPIRELDIIVTNGSLSLTNALALQQEISNAIFFVGNTTDPWNDIYA